MKMSTLIALLSCLLCIEVSRADNLNEQCEQEVKRELCRLETATKFLSRSNQKAILRSCEIGKVNFAGWLGEFLYEPSYPPKGFLHQVLPPANALKSEGDREAM